MTAALANRVVNCDQTAEIMCNKDVEQIRYFGQQKLWEEQMQDEYSLTSKYGGGTKKCNW